MLNDLHNERRVAGIRRLHLFGICRGLLSRQTLLFRHISRMSGALQPDGRGDASVEARSRRERDVEPRRLSNELAVPSCVR